jgi:hypothetical protein
MPPVRGKLFVLVRFFFPPWAGALKSQRPARDAAVSYSNYIRDTSYRVDSRFYFIDSKSPDRANDETNYVNIDVSPSVHPGNRLTTLTTLLSIRRKKHATERPRAALTCKMPSGRSLTEVLPEQSRLLFAGLGGPIPMIFVELAELGNQKTLASLGSRELCWRYRSVCCTYLTSVAQQQ